MPWTGQDKTHTSGDELHPKHRDPFRFIPADDFFESFSATHQPVSVSYKPEDQLTDEKTRNVLSVHGRVFRFNNESVLLIQFIRPFVWRIQFHPGYRRGSEFTDWNTRTLLQGRLSKLTRILDTAEEINWDVEFDHNHVNHYVLRSVIVSHGKRHPAVELWIQRSPFRITAVRSIKNTSTSLGLCSDGEIQLDIPGPSGRAIIWQTKENPLQYEERATILSVEKHPQAKYMGFGGQGGKNLTKDQTYMNYFNFDNMRYNNIYAKGPEEGAEPLYHSEPFWIEANRHPGYMSQVATFIDNYSHVCLDIGKTDNSSLRIATRFNSFQGIFMAGNNIAEVIRLYTSIIGKPRLMPRYVLGYHQGCYGYDRQWKVEEVVRQYRQHDFPLDGMHIDVDIQRGYRTFTIDRNRFPEPEDMFSKLRDQGVRCSTNITPVINCTPDPTYASLNEGLAHNHFVLDRRELDPSAPKHHDQRYMQYGNADLYFTNPNAVDRRPYPDSYDFAAHFNKSVPFHGGVSYGDGQGAPGHYPNLNNKHTRDWWGEQYKDLFDAGLEFVWQDMTSPCIGEAYGDMKSWPFRLLLDSDDWPGEQRQRRLSNAAAIHHKYELKTAIELWSLYSLNLHKATFKGLKQLDTRKGKRNFIIGRGSFAGAQRYAGLWTGDNASTWEFLKVSVAQVLSLGLSGMTIAGADVGGFELAFGEENFASPELLIRWYCTNSLLPWFRNHYSGRHEPFEDNPNQPRDTDKKLFQEPYKYEEYYRDNKDRIPEHERRLYEAVLPVCRYYVRLRYSLMQLLYDAMFESTITGLPIARAMIITDPSDGSLFTKNEPYTHTQYLAGNDILVAPALQTESLSTRRQVYLPSSSSWYPMNLRPHDDDTLGEALLPSAPGATYISYDCRISASPTQLPFTCPMYIREGAIIPTIRVRSSIPDRTRPSLSSTPCNPITINVYPGRDNTKPTTYRMYLDDGVSRSSAPDPTYFAALPHHHHHHHHHHDATPARPNNAHGDGEARGNFRRVDVKQRIRTVEADNPGSGAVLTRTITVATGWDGAAGKEGEQAPEEGWYDDARVRRDVGGEYRVVVWHEAGTRMEGVVVEVVGAEKARREVDEGRRASVVWVPVDAGVKTTIRVRYEGGGCARDE